jgi:hypothetical protein
MTVPTQTPLRRTTHAQGRRASVWSLVMLPVFAVWTVAFILLSGVVAGWLGLQTQGGEVVYLEEWLPWIAASILWALPLMIGVGLAVQGLRRGAGTIARVALGVNGIALLLMVGPSLIDRFLHL